jgi:uncharacterized membrane protein YgaE (UPF0421/DUF939 family)
MGLLGGVCKASVEGFMGMTDSESRKEAYSNFISIVVAYLIAIVLIAFIGKYLWNYAVVDLFSIAKPARSIWQIIALMFVLSILMP